MKLWLLRPIDPDAGGDNPWEPWYDKLFGAVVRAETEDQARLLVSAHAGDEKDYYIFHKDKRKAGKPRKVNPWLDPKFTSCEELTADGLVEVIIKDFHSA